MDIKKTTKYDGKLVDSEGEIIDLIDVLEKVYGDRPFDLSTTCKTEEIIDVEEFEDEEE